MVGTPAPEPPAWVSGRLDERIVALLESHPGHLAFNGLRRALQAHPESLQRALRRLERDGIVRRDPIGYALAQLRRPSGVRPPSDPPHEVARIELPLGTIPEEFLGRLAGRWVGPLRWVGLLDDPADPRLVWAVPGRDGQVVAAVREGRLLVTVDAPGGEPAGELVDAARDLVVYSVRHLGSNRGAADRRTAELSGYESGIAPGNN